MEARTLSYHKKVSIFLKIVQLKFKLINFTLKFIRYCVNFLKKKKNVPIIYPRVHEVKQHRFLNFKISCFVNQCYIGKETHNPYNIQNQQQWHEEQRRESERVCIFIA